MTEKYSFEIPKIPQELHQNLWQAQEAFETKVAHIERLNHARDTLQSEVEQMEAEREKAKSNYVEGFGDIAKGKDKFPKSAKDASAKVSDLAVRIASHKEVIPDYGNQITNAALELEQLAQDVEFAKGAILRVLIEGSPDRMPSPRKQHSIMDFVANGESLDLFELLMLFVARESYSKHAMGKGDVIPSFVTGQEIMGFVGDYFTDLSRDNVRNLQERLNVMIWGGRDPAPKIKVQERPNYFPQIHFDGKTYGGERDASPALDVDFSKQRMGWGDREGAR